eukprot:347832_1
MAVLSPTSIAYKYVQASFYGTEIVIVSMILLIEMRTFYYTLKYHDDISSTSTKTRSNANKSNLQYTIPMISYVLYVIAAVAGVISIFHAAITSTSCIVYSAIGISAYMLAKMSMYFVFIYRLHIVYSDSVFAYKSNSLLTLVILISVIILVLIITNALTMHTQIFINVKDQKTCVLHVWSVVLGCWTVFDNIVNILCCYLFVRPLLKLRQIEGTENRSNVSWQRMYQLLLKYVILTMIIVISTFVVLPLMAILKINAIGTVDVMINCCCLALFNKHYNVYYMRVCHGAISIGHKWCKKTEESPSDE